MNGKLKRICPELKRFFETEFGKSHFTIVYGSYAYDIDSSSSDLDYVTVCREFDDAALKRTIDFTFDLYKRYGLALDDEVPHENKLLADYQRLEDAIAGKGFERKDGRIWVPPVVKTEEFLTSEGIAKRLLLNAITSKNVFVSGDKDYYLQKREEALESMVGFIFSIEGKSSFELENFVTALIGTPERHGEMYLGYKNEPRIREYLLKTFREAFDKLAARGILQYNPSNNSYSLQDESWLKAKQINF